MITSADGLRGKRILVVEDEFLIASLIETVLAQEGCCVVGPVSTLAKALEAANTEEVDAALLDVNLAGKYVFPAAEALMRRDIPFVFLSGYGDTIIPRNRPDWQVLSKPFRNKELLAALLESLAVEHC